MDSHAINNVLEPILNARDNCNAANYKSSE